MHDKEYLEKNPNWHSEDAVYKASWIKDLIDQWLPIRGKKVADIGCGSGEVLRNLSRYFPEAYWHGYEISETAYSICKHIEKAPQLEFYQADILQSNPEHCDYDLILCIDVFEHIADNLSFLKSLSNYAAHFIYHIPLELSVQTVVRSTGLLNYRSKYGHLHFYNRQLALQILIECGYQIIEWRYTPSALVLPGRNLKSRFLKIPRHLLMMISQELCARLLGGLSLLVYCKSSKAAGQGNLPDGITL